MGLTASFFHESYEGRLTAELHNLGLTRTNARVKGGRLVQELCTCSRSSFVLVPVFRPSFRPRFSRHLRTALTNAETMHDLVITSYIDHSYALSEESD